MGCDFSESGALHGALVRAGEVAMTLRVRALREEEGHRLARMTRSQKLGAGLVRRAQIIQHAVDGLRACFESYGAGNRLRLGWARRWSMRRIAARVTIASDTSGGYDAVKRVKGRKRHIAVDTDGRLLMVNLVPANVQDAKG